MTNLHFGDAFNLLKKGKKVARLGWNGKGMFLSLVEGSLTTYRPHIIIQTSDGELVPWVASQSDVLAEDWLEVTEW